MVSKTGNVNQGIPHFQVGDVNFKVEGGILQNQYAKQSVFYFHFHIFIFENKVGRGERGNAIRWAICLVSDCCGMSWLILMSLDHIITRPIICVRVNLYFRGIFQAKYKMHFTSWLLRTY
jgi:hypothetical protein